MLWYYEKISEDDSALLYSYGWNTEEKTGRLLYDKSSQETTVKKIADNDNQKGAEWAASHLSSVLIQEKFPEKTVVQIG